MKIIVTGSNGHIGSYLVREFAFEFPGSEIVMIDSMLTQRFPSLFNLPSVGRYKFLDEDIVKADLNRLFEGADFVVHLAAMTDAAGSFHMATELEENNFLSTMKVADSCLNTGAMLIELSSTSVYGTQKKIVSEDCHVNELKPQSPYAVTKLKEENYVGHLVKKKGLRAVTLRLGTIFGASPGMRFHTAVNKFCWQAVMGQPITVWKTAYEQMRPYLDILDASNAIKFVIRKNLFDGQIYNVLTCNSTVHNIVDIVQEFIPNLAISFVDNEIMNQLSYEVSCEKFISQGFTFSGNLRKGIGDTISLLRQANS